VSGASANSSAAELGRRRRDDNLPAVFASDLTRAVETATIAFGGTGVPVFLDWRLRECDYGRRDGTPARDLHRKAHLETPYPGGESWRQAVARVGRAIDDIAGRWAGQRVLVIGHVATRWALEQAANGQPLEDLVDADFAWQEGWEYRIR
jgi:2,3-bisphosphoglycerate-dependent phosphoglycerate mutase